MSDLEIDLAQRSAVFGEVLDAGVPITVARAPIPPPPSIPETKEEEDVPDSTPLSEKPQLSKEQQLREAAQEMRRLAQIQRNLRQELQEEEDANAVAQGLPPPSELLEEQRKKTNSQKDFQLRKGNRAVTYSGPGSSQFLYKSHIKGRQMPFNPGYNQKAVGGLV